MSALLKHLELAERQPLLKVSGRVTCVTGLTVETVGLRVQVGAMCRIMTASSQAIDAQAVGFRGDYTVLMPLVEPTGVSAGDIVETRSAAAFVGVGRLMIGRMVNGLGQPTDGKGSFIVEEQYPIVRPAPSPGERVRIDEAIGAGIRSIDALHTVGRGQRLGVFAGTGVGKSVLMGMIARDSAADVNVVALVGERGREVGDFIGRDLGEEGLKRSVLVVSTSDESPVLRVRAGFVATAIAEYFRDRGADVLLMMDSLTRLAMAQRQIGLAAGEPPATKGYPPSAFAMLPPLVERVGRTREGSITALYTVLVEGDDVNEPIADAVRGVLDGHVWLSRKLANRGHYPAIAPLESISRLMVDVVDDEHMQAARTVRSVLATWEDIEDLVNIGAYAAGANADYDVAVRMKPRIDAFLRQAMNETASLAESRAALIELSKQIAAARKQPERGAARKPPAAKE